MVNINMDEINIYDFDVVCEENGQVSITAGKIVLEHRVIGERLAVVYEDVAEFYGLKQIEEPTSQIVSRSKNEHTAEIYKWCEDETHTLLNLYCESQDKVGPLKNFRNKKEMWAFISQECNRLHNIDVTPEQAEGRFKTVIKKTEAVLKNNRTSGATRKRIPFESTMEKIIKNDDSIMPVVFVGPNKLLRKEQLLERNEERSSTSGYVPPTETSAVIEVAQRTAGNTVSDVENETDLLEDVPRRKKKKDVAEKMIDRLIENREERFKKREEGKERRHREKMEKLSEIQNTLLNISQNRPPT